MSGVQIACDLRNDLLKAHLFRLKDFGGAGINKAARGIGSYMVGEIQAHFDGQTLWDDSAMPQSQAAIDREGQTLIDRRVLYKSYHEEVNGADIALGSDGLYAAIHHAGGAAGRGHKTHIDPRPVLGVNPRNEADIIDEIIGVIRGLE